MDKDTFDEFILGRCAASAGRWEQTDVGRAVLEMDRRAEAARREHERRYPPPPADPDRVHGADEVIRELAERGSVDARERITALRLRVREGGASRDGAPLNTVTVEYFATGAEATRALEDPRSGAVDFSRTPGARVAFCGDGAVVAWASPARTPGAHRGYGFVHGVDDAAIAFCRAVRAEILGEGPETWLSRHLPARERRAEEQIDEPRQGRRLGRRAGPA